MLSHARQTFFLKSATLPIHPLDSHRYGHGVTYSTAYAPVYASQEMVPASYTNVEQSVYDPNAAWWAFQFLNNWAHLNFRAINPELRAAAGALESKTLEEQVGGSGRALRAAAIVLLAVVSPSLLLQTFASFTLPLTLAYALLPLTLLALMFHFYPPSLFSSPLLPSQVAVEQEAAALLASGNKPEALAALEAWANKRMTTAVSTWQALSLTLIGKVTHARATQRNATQRNAHTQFRGEERGGL